MNPAGYSGTPLAKKLGIKPDHRVWLIQPADGLKDLLNSQVEATYSETEPAQADVILLFVDSLANLTTQFSLAAKKLVINGGLWVCWPKKSSGIQTDLTETLIRDFGLSTGLVDNKICAVDATWSGLRFVIRLKDR